MLCKINQTFAAHLPETPVFYAGETIEVPDALVPRWQRQGLLEPAPVMVPGDLLPRALETPREAPRQAQREVAARLRAPNTRKRR